jgi:hypothetical protein
MGYDSGHPPRKEENYSRWRTELGTPPREVHRCHCDIYMLSPDYKDILLVCQIA